MSQCRGFLQRSLSVRKQSDLAGQTLKDPYNFEFLPLSEEYNEIELEEALVEQITQFLLELGTGAIAYLNTQVKEKTYLGQDGLFVTEEEYPKFVRQEIIVNAVTHRLWKALHNIKT